MASLKNIRVSTRYATALFELAVEMKLIEDVKKDMEMVNGVVEASRDLLTVFRSPLVNADKKIAILKELFQSRVCELTIKFLSLITRKGRIVCLDAISNSYLQMYQKYFNIKTVFVESAVGLDASAREKIKQMLEKHTSCSITLSPQVNESLIGGFRLRFDDYLYDLSLRHRIVVMKKEFERNIYERKL